MAGAAIRAIWKGVASEPPCVSGRGPHERCLGGAVGGHPAARAWEGGWGIIPAGISGGGVCWGGCPQWSAGHAI